MNLPHSAHPPPATRCHHTTKLLLFSVANIISMVEVSSTEIDMPPEASPNPSKPTMTAPIAFKQRGRRSKESFRKRPANSVISPTSESPYDSSSSGGDEDPSDVPRVKRARKGIVSDSTVNVKAPSEGHSPTAFRANREMQLSNSNDATKRKDWYDQPASNGPTRAASNVRITTTTDFAPDVCKDYKRSGWCGFGDSCVFAHDRSDMKQGWQLDREWEINTKKQRDAGSTVGASVTQDQLRQANAREDDEAILGNVPFLCIICEGPYRQPVVTQCGHYFCEACALQRYRKDPTCKNCGAATMGVFNAASRLERLMRGRRERKEATTDMS